MPNVTFLEARPADAAAGFFVSNLNLDSTCPTFIHTSPTPANRGDPPDEIGNGF